MHHLEAIPFITANLDIVFALSKHRPLLLRLFSDTLSIGAMDRLVLLTDHPKKAAASLVQGDDHRNPTHRPRFARIIGRGQNPRCAAAIHKLLVEAVDKPEILPRLDDGLHLETAPIIREHLLQGLPSESHSRRGPFDIEGDEVQKTENTPDDPASGRLDIDPVALPLEPTDEFQNRGDVPGVERVASGHRYPADMSTQTSYFIDDAIETHQSASIKFPGVLAVAIEAADRTALQTHEYLRSAQKDALALGPQVQRIDGYFHGGGVSRCFSPNVNAYLVRFCAKNFSLT